MGEHGLLPIRCEGDEEGREGRQGGGTGTVCHLGIFMDTPLRLQPRGCVSTRPFVDKIHGRLIRYIKRGGW